MAKNLVERLEMCTFVAKSSETNKQEFRTMEKIKVEAKREGLSMSIDRERFAVALHTYRLRRGLTQQQLANEWGISRESVIRAEKARRMSWAMAYRIFAKLSDDLEKGV